MNKIWLWLTIVSMIIVNILQTIRIDKLEKKASWDYQKSQIDYIRSTTDECIELIWGAENAASMKVLDIMLHAEKLYPRPYRIYKPPELKLLEFIDSGKMEHRKGKQIKQ